MEMALNDRCVRVLGRSKKKLLSNELMLRVTAFSTRDRRVCTGIMYFGGVLGRDTHLAEAEIYGTSTEMLLFATVAFLSTKRIF